MDLSPGWLGRAVRARRASGFPREHRGRNVGSRGARNREHSVTFRATEETNILHQTDARNARGITAGTRGEWLVEKP
jgi:hypothetical protein